MKGQFILHQIVFRPDLRLQLCQCFSKVLKHHSEPLLFDLIKVSEKTGLGTLVKSARIVFHVECIYEFLRNSKSPGSLFTRISKQYNATSTISIETKHVFLLYRVFHHLNHLLSHICFVLIIFVSQIFNSK